MILVDLSSIYASFQENKTYKALHTETRTILENTQKNFKAWD